MVVYAGEEKRTLDSNEPSPFQGEGPMACRRMNPQAAIGPSLLTVVDNYTNEIIEYLLASGGRLAWKC